jgi:hypothetical protein
VVSKECTNIPIGGGHFAKELGGHFKLELGEQYDWNLQIILKSI